MVKLNWSNTIIDIKNKKMSKKTPIIKKESYPGDAKNLIYIIKPFDALTIYSALEYVEDHKEISKSLKGSIQEFKKQTEKHITDEQINDAKAEFSVRNLLNNY